MTKESFLRGAVILALASTLSRLIGLVYMVVLPRLISDQGMGLYQLVKPIHYFAAVVAIGGMPVAISKLIAEKVARGSRQEVLGVFRLGLLMMLTTGGLVAATLFFGAPWLAQVFAKDLGVTKMLAIIGPACLFLALSAGFRGFFQGMQSMTPTAISQVIDQIVRVVVTIALCTWLRPRGIEMAVTGVAWGFFFGELTGWLVLAGYFFTLRHKLLADIRPSRLLKPESPKRIVARLVSLAFPAVVATVLWPIMQLADSMLIPMRMQMAGFSAETIREGLGHLGMALTLSQFPNIVTVALATSLVPAISEAWALGSKKLIKYRAEEALRIALIFGIPACAALMVLAEPLSQLLFGYGQVGVPLRILAAGTITLGVLQASTGVLQGLGVMSVPVRNFGLGVVCKFALNYILVAHPQLGILGAAWSTTLAWMLVAVLNLASVFRRVGGVINWKISLAFPAVAAGLTSVLMYLLQDTLVVVLPKALATIGALLVGLVVYFLVLMSWGSLTERDVRLIPGVGAPLAVWLHNWGFLRN